MQSRGGDTGQTLFCPNSHLDIWSPADWVGPILGLFVLLLKPVNIVAVLSLGLVSLSTSMLRAEEHIVIILQATYFPQTTAVEEGDVVRFVNRSGAEHTISHAEAAWMTQPMANNEELLIEFGPGMFGEFSGHITGDAIGRIDKVRPPVEGESNE